MAEQLFWDAGLRGWIANTARANRWRVPAWYGLEDLEQDGYLCYCKCLNRYAAVVVKMNRKTANQRRHFMALVQVSFLNHIMTLAAKFSQVHELAVSQLPGAEDIVPWDTLVPPEPECASLMTALLNAPEELAAVLRKLTQDGVDGGNYVRSRLYQQGGRVKRGRRAVRETTADYWERCLGQPGVPEKLADYLR